MKPNLTATSAFQLLIQGTADVTDRRTEAIACGAIYTWMTDDEGIGIMLARHIINVYEEKLSPQIMTSLLMNYCRDDITKAFLDYFCQISNKRGVVVDEAVLMNQQIDVRIDIHQAAINGKAVGWKLSWGPFKEPYLSEWVSGFNLSDNN